MVQIHCSSRVYRTMVTTFQSKTVTHPNKSVFEDLLQGTVDAVADVLHADAGTQDDGIVEVGWMTFNEDTLCSTRGSH